MARPNFTARLASLHAQYLEVQQQQRQQEAQLQMTQAMLQQLLGGIAVLRQLQQEAEERSGKSTPC